MCLPCIVGSPNNTVGNPGIKKGGCYVHIDGSAVSIRLSLQPRKLWPKGWHGNAVEPGGTYVSI